MAGVSCVRVTLWVIGEFVTLYMEGCQSNRGHRDQRRRRCAQWAPPAPRPAALRREEPLPALRGRVRRA